MNKFFCSALLSIACMIFSLCVPAQVRVQLRVDTMRQFQTMEGFGAFNTISAWTQETAARKYDLIANDLGLSILRFELPPTFRAQKDSPYNVRGTVFGGPDLLHNFQDVREMAKRGVTKFIASIWSPPVWMKTPNEEGKGPSLDHGGSLRPDAYGDFASYCAAFCRVFREQTGIVLYGIGLQNEPEFPEPYNSCVYTPEQLREAVRAVGRKFKEEGITTRIYGPEALPAQGHLGDFFKVINDDAETRDYSSIFAIHNYDRDGINVGGAGSRDWDELAALASSTDPVKGLWMTETSGHPDNWGGAMLLAANIYNAIEHGHLSAWLWWSLSDKKASAPYGLIIDGVPSGRYYVSRQFYRFIRPGAVRVEAAANNPDVLPLAFIRSGRHKLVLVIINKGEADAMASLPDIVKGQPFAKMLSTDGSHSRLLSGSSSGVIRLPPKSVSTLTWD